MKKMMLGLAMAGLANMAMADEPTNYGELAAKKTHQAEAVLTVNKDLTLKTNIGTTPYGQHHQSVFKEGELVYYANLFAPLDLNGNMYLGIGGQWATITGDKLELADTKNQGTLPLAIHVDSDYVYDPNLQGAKEYVLKYSKTELKSNEGTPYVRITTSRAGTFSPGTYILQSFAYMFTL